MKNSVKLFLLIIGLSIMSCNNTKTEKNIKMYSDTWDHIVNDGNLDLINNTNFTEDITMISSPENIVGIDNFKAYYQNFITGFSDIKFTVVDIFGQDDNIVKHWNFKGKHTGDFFGMPATGKSVDIEGVTIAKMKDGKIAQEQDFMDNTVFLQQLGIVSSPENTSIIDSLYKAFGTGDIPTVLSKMDANIVWNEAEGNAYADGNPYVGPDTVLNGVFARVGGEWDGFKLVNIQLHDMFNNQVLATLRYNGTYKKTNKPIDAQAAHLWTLNDGKVIAFQQYVDTKQLADAIK
ncbi:ester cyclase [Mariniflexile sp. HNIBRBA6329]|uniref:ester cyclase n=1 Tax=Mariniflexile sp. HNIBRBA6329 TaxID=3373088 RepID=UPI0037467FEC